MTTELLSATPSSTVGTNSAAVVSFKAKLTVLAPSSAEATMSSDSETDTLTFSGLDDDSAGFDAIRVNTASAPSIVAMVVRPAICTEAGP